MCNKNQVFYVTVYARSVTVSDEVVDNVRYEQWFYVDRTVYLVGKKHKSVNLTQRYDAIANLAMNHALSLGMSPSAMRYKNGRGGKRKGRKVSDKQKELF